MQSKMKSIIARNPHLTARIVIPLGLQLLLVVMLSRPNLERLQLNLGLILFSVLAMAPIASAPRWLPFWKMLMLGLLRLFALLVFLAPLLHLVGWNRVAFLGDSVNFCHLLSELSGKE
jgi:hypothetical protein